jgi:hypothetical protein
MCFVSFIPTSTGYLLGSNRDEHILREPAQAPLLKMMESSQKKVLAPADGKAGGTWIAAREDGWSIVLLNGAFEKHIAKPPYRHSRGLIIPRLMEQELPPLIWEDFPLHQIEPFTLIMTNGKELWEMRRDEDRSYQRALDCRIAHCWSSATLYNPEQQQIREDWFMNWLDATTETDARSLMDFHQSHPGPETYSITLKRENGIETVSTTLVECSGYHLNLLHADYRSDKETQHPLSITVKNSKKKIATNEQLV